MHALLFMVAGLLIGGDSDDRKGGTEGQFPSVAAAEISRAFEYNDALADERYVGQKVDVVVRIERIDRDAEIKAPTAKYKATTRMKYNKLVFYFDPTERSELAKLTPPDQVVVIQGFCKGGACFADDGVPGWIIFSDCKILRIVKAKEDKP